MFCILARDNAGACRPVRVVIVGKGMRVAVHKIFLVDDNLLQGRMLRVHAFVQDSDSNTSLPWEIAQAASAATSAQGTPGFPEFLWFQ